MQDSLSLERVDPDLSRLFAVPIAMVGAAPPVPMLLIQIDFTLRLRLRK